MQEKITVQKFSENEWLISGILQGNIKATNLVIMVHNGGYDKNENGPYPVLENNQVKKVNNKIIFTKKKYGNYEILTNTIIKDEDWAVFRYDLRNHGNSIINSQYDKRDMQYTRYAKDLHDIIKYIQKNYNYSNIYLIGTGTGALIIEYYIVKYYSKESEKFIKSISLISPNSPKMIYNTNPINNFLYQKQDYILKTHKQFTKIKGIFEGPKTINEAKNNYNLELEYANLKIPTNYILSVSDRLTPLDIYLPIINEIKKINPKIEVNIINKEYDYGNTDHAFYDEETYNTALETIYQFLLTTKESNN